MVLPGAFQVESLSQQHDRTQFCCGIDSLDHYLRRHANQDKRRNSAAPYVLIETSCSCLIGYYTLSQSSVQLDDLTETTRKKFGPYPSVGATLIGRFAVDREWQGRGLGSFLLFDALERSFTLSRRIAAGVVVVDAIGSEAKDFYLRHEFIQFAEEPLRLYMPMYTIERLINKS